MDSSDYLSLVGHDRQLQIYGKVLVHLLRGHEENYGYGTNCHVNVLFYTLRIYH